MVVFPNAKINLGLNIIEKRADGFHNIETVFLPIKICDILEVISTKDEMIFSSTGLAIDGNVENNLCLKAYYLLKKEFGLPPIKIHLHKVIPMGAGLGGGSANAAFVLNLLNNKFQLNLTQKQLLNYALQLGSDCPFFILNKPAFASSRGEELQPINLNLTAYKILIINPKIHISTAWAFNNITPQKPIQSIKSSIQLPIEDWKHNLTNAFEIPVFNCYPSIQKIKEILYINGAVYASLTGSGSTVYGIFKKEEIPINIEFNENYFVQWVDVL